MTSVAADIGYSRTIIYCWRKRLQQKGMVGLMPPKEAIQREKLITAASVPPPASSDEIQRLQEQISDMKMDIDILKETITVLTQLSHLNNR